MKIMHLLQVAGIFSCEFLIAKVAPFLHAPVTKHRTSKNGTTSTKEISTAKYSNATLPQKHDLHFWCILHLKYKLDLEFGIYVRNIRFKYNSLKIPIFHVD